jgi:Phage tail assembly chaperone protein, TAC
VNFTENATRLFGQCALTLGWRPAEFWNATPTELEAVLAAYAAHEKTPPDAVDVQKLMVLFPDAPTGVE